MTKPDFYGPRLKLERAEQHINELEGVFAAYISENAKRMSADTNKRTAGAVGAGFPTDTPTILGDALHNIRACLDHAWCALIEANGGKPLPQSHFPFGRKDWQSIEGSIKGHEGLKAAPSRKIVEYIRDEVQPYPGGKLDLLDVHDLDIADKHMVLLPTSVTFSTSETPLIIRTDEGRELIWSGIDFEGDLSKHPHFSFIAGGIHEYAGDPEKAFEISFGKGQPLEGKPILPTFKRLVAAVRKVLDDLERLA